MAEQRTCRDSRSVGAVTGGVKTIEAGVVVVGLGLSSDAQQDQQPAGNANVASTRSVMIRALRRVRARDRTVPVCSR